jgi:hypothetical protein
LASRRSPRSALIVATSLTIPTVAILRSWHKDRVRVNEFLARADSTRGRIKTAMNRVGAIQVDYRVELQDYSVLDRPSRSDAALVVGDSIWLYYEPSSPYQAHVSRPEADSTTPKVLLAVTWLLGTSGLLGYGTALARWTNNPNTGTRAT